MVTPKSHDEPGRFVPKGVDAQSWLGFEQRIQDRRYTVLIETARASILAGDLSSAQAAIDEARELRPAAEELDSLEFSLNSEPPIALPADPPFFGSRVFGAAAMLVVGITLVTTIDYVRGDGTARVVSAPALRLPGLRVPLPPVGDIPHPITALRSQPSPVIPIGTAGLEVRLTGEINIPPSLRERNVTVPETLPLPPGEIPDDFVYPYTRSTPSPSSSRPAISAGAAAPDRLQPAAKVAAVPVVAAPLMTPSPIPGAFESLTPSRSTSAVPSPAAAPAENVPEAATPSVPRSAINPPAATQAALTPSNPATFGTPRTSTSTRPASQAGDDAKVAEVLNAYARAYGELDAAAARAVWPSVDERALARAFSTLSSQTVSFADCRIDVEGVTALAACRGYASYVGKIGSGGTRTEPRQWRFELRRVGEEWRIQNAVVASRE
jgi:hypothetical protein